MPRSLWQSADHPRSLDCISIGSRNIEGAGSWRTVVGIGFVWPLILGIGILFMPESPRWLTAHGRYEEARRAIAQTRGVPVEEAETHRFVHRELEEMRSAIEFESKEKAGWLECFRPQRMSLYRTLLGKSPFPLSQRTSC